MARLRLLHVPRPAVLSLTPRGTAAGTRTASQMSVPEFGSASSLSSQRPSCHTLHSLSFSRSASVMPTRYVRPGPAPLNPVQPALGLSAEFCATRETTLVLRQKILSASGDSFLVTDTDGVPVVEVQGKALSLMGRRREPLQAFLMHTRLTPVVQRSRTRMGACCWSCRTTAASG